MNNKEKLEKLNNQRRILDKTKSNLKCMESLPQTQNFLSHYICNLMV